MRILKAKFGFTLAELLIALAILGVIVTFTIPKILNSQTNNQKKAVFKETIAALNQLMYLATLQNLDWSAWGSIPGCSYGNAYCFLTTRMNALKICPSLTDIAPCFAATDVTGFPIFPGVPSATQGVLLANGASIVLDWTGGSSLGVVGRFLVDWNGPVAPNLIGDDQVVLIGAYGPQRLGATYPRPGTAAVAAMGVPAENTKNIALYEQIFQ